MLDLQNVSRWYGEVIALNDVSAEIGTGITALLGPNGAGKSTLMRLAMGLLRPSMGTVRVLGEDPWANPRLLTRIGYVPEGPAPWRELSGADCARRAARLAGMDDQAAKEAARDALAEVGLEDAADRAVAGYSQGMAQRLKFALARVHRPSLYILDEPLAGTDPTSRRHLLALLRRLQDEGAGILLSTHVLSDVEALTDRILLIDHGRLLAHGDVETIRGLLDRYPRTVRISTSDPAALATQLAAWDEVRSVAREESAVVVQARDAASFYPRLQVHLLQAEVPFSGLTSPDDNVESVFRYLTEGRA